MRENVEDQSQSNRVVTRRRFLATSSVAAGAISLTSVPVMGGHLEVNPSPPPDGTIEASEFEWIQPGAPETGNDCGLRISDDGGVDIGFHYQTEGDLTIDFHWRHHEGGDLAYMWNDQDVEEGSEFRAFTNGTADEGIVVRLPWDDDIFASHLNLHDGQWHNIRVVMDTSAATSTLYVDGNQEGQSGYDGSGFTSSDPLRVMGRASGSTTLIDYDRYVWLNEAIHPEDNSMPESDLLHYELDDCEGSIVTNAVGETPCIERRYRGRGDEDIPPCDQTRWLNRESEPRQRPRRSRSRDGR